MNDRRRAIIGIDKESNQGSTGLSYTLLSGGNAYACSGIGTCIETDISIGSVYQGKPVTQISPQAFHNNKTITGVFIPSSIQMLEFKSFSGCSNLSSIIMDEGSSLGSASYIFANCKLRGAVTKLPESVTQIPGSCFETQQGSGIAKYILGSHVTSIGAYSFRLTNIKIIFQSVTPPTFGTNWAASEYYHSQRFYVPYQSIDEYKSAPNATDKASAMRPLVNTTADLLTIDTSKYTVACVVGENKDFIEYQYDGLNWNAIS